MKKLGLILGSVLLVAGLAGCNDKDTSSDNLANEKTAETQVQQKGLKKLNIGFTAYKFDDNFIALYRKVIKKRAEGDKDKVNLTMNDSQNAQQIQNDQIDTMLSKGTDGLAINLVDPASGGTVINKLKKEKKDNNKEIPIVFYNKKPSKEVINSYPQAYYVGIDPNAQGIAQGKLIEKMWKENPNIDLNHDGVIQYVMLKGEPGHPDAEARTLWSIKTLNNDGIKTQELALDAAMWDTAMAKDKMDAWLAGKNGNNIEVVICNNDGMALGAIEALKAANKKIPVFGVDALPEALVKIKNGEMAGTVLNDADGQANATWDMIVNLAAGKKPTEGTNLKLENKEILIPSIGIDKDNVDKFIKK